MQLLLCSFMDQTLPVVCCLQGQDTAHPLLCILESKSKPVNLEGFQGRDHVFVTEVRTAPWGFVSKHGPILAIKNEWGREDSQCFQLV